MGYIYITLSFDAVPMKRILLTSTYILTILLTNGYLTLTTRSLKSTRKFESIVLPDSINPVKSHY